MLVRVDGRPDNLASETVRANYGALSRVAELTEDEIERMRERYADGFVREDRRRFVTIPSATFDEFIGSIRTYWELGAGAPTFSVPEILAVRGERLVLFRSRVAFANDTATESLVVLLYDTDLRALRAIMFHELDAAIDELDRLHADIA